VTGDPSPTSAKCSSPSPSRSSSPPRSLHARPRNVDRPFEILPLEDAFTWSRRRPSGGRPGSIFLLMMEEPGAHPFCAGPFSEDDEDEVTGGPRRSHLEVVSFPLPLERGTLLTFGANSALRE